jgi:hypothetical protein
MTETSKPIHYRYRENFIGALSAGFFFVLIGLTWAITPNIYNNVIDFFKNFDIAKVPNTEIRLPAPTSPSAHLNVYSAAAYFALAFGVFQIFILALRFAYHSPLAKKAESASDIIFWLGAYYLNTTFLNESLTLSIWFEFWAQIIMLLGVGLVVRAIILATRM